MKVDKFEVQALLLAKITGLAKEDSDIAVLWVYGSRAKGEFKDESDYDLAVAFTNFNLTVSNRYLRPNILAMEWVTALGIDESKLSIIDINTSPVYLTFNVVEYGIILYQEPSMRSIKEQNRIYSQYEYQMIESRRNA